MVSVPAWARLPGSASAASTVEDPPWWIVPIRTIPFQTIFLIQNVSETGTSSGTGGTVASTCTIRGSNFEFTVNCSPFIGFPIPNWQFASSPTIAAAMTNAPPTTTALKAYMPGAPRPPRKFPELPAVDSYPTIDSANYEALAQTPPDSEGMYGCPVCSKRVTSAHHLRIHYDRIHLRLKPHKCTLCSFGGYNKQELVEHTRMKHTGERPFGCPSCSKRLFTRQSQQEHWYRKHAEKKFQCPQCDSRFALELHVNYHVKRKHLAFHCQFCSKKTSRPCWHSHVRLMHRGERARNADTCAQCRRPRRSSVDVDSARYRCAKCRRCFYSFSSPFAVCVCESDDEIAKCRCEKPVGTRERLDDTDSMCWQSTTGEAAAAAHVFQTWWFGDEELRVTRMLGDSGERYPQYVEEVQERLKNMPASASIQESRKKMCAISASLRTSKPPTCNTQ